MKFLFAMGAIIGVLAILAITAAGIGQMRWNRGTQDAVRSLRGNAEPAPDILWSPEMTDTLPAPVARYFRFALLPGRPLPRSTTLDQVGEFLTKPDGNWSPFTAIEHLSTRPPGFVWDASIGTAPLITVRVRDGYRDGHGKMLARVAGLLTVAEGRDTPELAQGALARYLAEAVWIPTALLPGEGLAWVPLDDSTARATLADRGNAVSVDFHFDPDGRVVRVSGMRYRDVDGQGVLTPWEGQFGDYRAVEGMMVPARGSVSWLLPEGRYTYWKGSVVGWEFQ
jgi:hypothetical protein